jgi:hypothetical protein
VGSFKCGLRDGEGQMFLPDGVYDGSWKRNKRYGQGIMWFNDGTIYLGDWQDNKYHGFGVLTQGNVKVFPNKFYFNYIVFS